jgi:hypothetical protein
MGSIVLSCDGLYIPTDKKVTMNLIRKSNGSFYYTVCDKNTNITIFTECLINKKHPLFENDGFSIMEKKIFEPEKASLSRYTIMTNFFVDNFNKEHNMCVYNNNYYTGETQNDIPHGEGVIMYGKTTNVCIKGNFRLGVPDGRVILYSKDQHTEVMCNDICNGIPVDYGTVYFKNQNVEKEFEFCDFYTKYPKLKNLKFAPIFVDIFIKKVSLYVLEESCEITNIKEFMFLNKTLEEQSATVYDILSTVHKEQLNQKYQLIVISKYINYFMCGIMLLGLYFVSNITQLYLIKS